MSAELGGADAAWLSNGTNPAQAVSESLPGDSDLPDERPDVPTPKERLAELAAEYPCRMNTPLSEQHGRKIRESCLDEPETISHEIPTGEFDTRTVSDTVSRKALPLYAAVADLLETYEGYRDKKLQMAKGYDDEAERFLVDLGISFAPEYQSKTYAKISALERQFTGGEYPSGGTVEAEFSEPMTVLFGLTASSKSEAAESGFRPFVDHDRAIRDAWSGDSSSVKRSLRYVLQDVLGLDATDYAWWWQAEPHPGDGEAAGYSHAHPIVILDAAECDRNPAEITPETFRPVVAKHVEQCDGAKWAAHKITDDEKSAVKVNRPDEIDDLASYVSKYLAIGPDEDLLERSPEYLMWAASQWATSTQKYSKSETATAAIDADRCQQEWLDPEAEQDRQHGERVVRAPESKQRRGINWVCSECGSHHSIDQSEQSLVRMRLDERETAATPTVAADGGLTVSAGCDDGHADDGDESGSDQPLRGRWPNATAAASISEPVRDRQCGHAEPDTCPLCATETESPDHTVSGEVPIPDHAEAAPATAVRDHFQREPEWRPEAIVQAWDDDDDGTPLGSPGGTAFGEVVRQDAVAAEIGYECEICGDVILRPDHPEPDEKLARLHLKSEHKTEIGATPYDEFLIESGRVRGESDQSPERNSPGSGADDAPDELADADAAAVRELVRTEGMESPVAVCGRLSINPDLVEAVGDVIGAT